MCPPEGLDNSALAPKPRASSTLKCTDKSKDNGVSQIRSRAILRGSNETWTKSLGAKTTSLDLHRSCDAIGQFGSEELRNGSMAAVRTAVRQARSRGSLVEVENSAMNACAERIKHLQRQIRSRNAGGLKQIQEPRENCQRYRIFTEVHEEDDSSHASSSTGSCPVDRALSHASATSSSEPCASDTPGEDGELVAPSAPCEIEIPSKDDDIVASSEMNIDTPSKAVLHDLASPKSPKVQSVPFELCEELLASCEMEVDTPCKVVDHSPKSKVVDSPRSPKIPSKVLDLVALYEMNAKKKLRSCSYSANACHSTFFLDVLD